MRRKFWMVLLGLGAVAGFASGFHSLRHYGGAFGPGCCHGPWESRRAAFEAHVADICTRSAERTLSTRGAPETRTSPAPQPP